MKNVYPGLESKRNLIHNVVKEEENSFLKTLDQGLLLLDSLISKNVDGKIDGSKVFQLYDTYGFPKDLTALILSEKGFSYDEGEFEKSMKKQKEISKKAALSSKSDWVIIHEDDLEEFVGYDHLTSNVKITRYRKTSSSKDGDIFQLVFNLTPFYPEGGGQVGDKGYLESANGDLIYIIDTKKENNLIIHYCNTLPNKIDGSFKAVVDKKQRLRSSCNHTSTHLLNQALREILGNHVEQRGSMVNSRGLRFDFSHFSKISKDQISQIEEFVNSRIKENLLLEENRNTLMEKALSEGAIALFGEKYGDTVRTVRFGKSIELCGGTHVESTSQIWHFKIISESAIASGVRRLEAITGDSCKMFFQEQSDDLEKIKELIKSPQNTVTAVKNIQSELHNLKNEIKKLSGAYVKSLKLELIDKIKECNGISLLSEKLSLNPKLIKPLAFDLGKSIKNLFMLIATTDGSKAILVCYIDKGLVEKKGFDARKIIDRISKHIKGTGGGQNFYSTAGGDDINGIDKAISSFNKMLDS
jgi:alanyl-tRNA synthetase